MQLRLALVVFISSYLLHWSSCQSQKQVTNIAHCIETSGIPFNEWSPGFNRGSYPNNIVYTWVYVSQPNTCINITFNGESSYEAFKYY